jgi:hypothetical protein
MSLDVSKLQVALRRELGHLTGKQRISLIRTTLVESGHECPELTDDTVNRFLAEKTKSPKPVVLEAFRSFLRAANPEAYRSVEAPTSMAAQVALLDAIKDFYVLDDGKQRRLAERLQGRYTIIRDAWMEGPARKNDVIFTEIVFDQATPVLLTAQELQSWQDEEAPSKERNEEEFGIAVQFRSNFALFLRSGHSSGGMIIHIFDNWNEYGGKIIKASGISQPIISRQEQIPTAIIMTERPIEDLGGARRLPRRDFVRDYPKLSNRFVDAEARHFLSGERQFELGLELPA